MLRHRGPDDEGFVLVAEGKARSFRGADSIPEVGELPDFRTAAPQGESVALGSRRLSIIDLSPSGHMPMSDEAGNWVVFNGEIYNYRELRQQLAALGYRFHSQCDTEVLLHAYAAWGTGCLEHFNGMWAFAIWDRQTRRLFCARDRFGEKQLYYCLTAEGSLCFASEIAPLRLVTPGNEPVRELVWDFLMYGLADHTSETFFTGIHQLLPGTYFSFTPGQPIQVTRYYDLREKRRAVPPDLSRAATQLREHLYDSVRLRLRSDVPVASFFTGGLDSASIVAVADRVLPALNGSSPCKTLRTYTNAYPAGHPYDESPRVRAALENMHCVDAVFVQASVDRFRSDLMTMVASQEQPFHNVSIFASYNLLRLIRQRDGIKVVLTGEAGDEVLAGYPHVYLPLHLSRMLASLQLHSWLREAAAWNWRIALPASAKGFFRKLPLPARTRLQRFRNPVVALMQPDFLLAHMQRDQEITANWRALDLGARLLADITQFNLPQLLRHLDRNAMHWSVETRVPFLDHRLVEFACSLPDEWKLRDGYSKFVLRQAMSSDLPEAITRNRTKLGFGMAEQFWLGACLHLLQPSAKFGEFIDASKLSHCVKAGAMPVEPAYWLPLSLGLWLQTAYPASH
jgi:asparagine synthase (glutamine-hydrolysing)